MLSTEEPAEYAQKLKQTIRPLANIAAYNNNLKTTKSPTVDQSIKKIYLKHKIFFVLS